MRLKHLLQFTVLPACLAAHCAVAQPFSSGSDGRDGNLTVTNALTLPAPPDGIFRFGSITVATNGTLTFTANSLNTPIYLLATNDILVAGVIDVSGANGATSDVSRPPGGPGGFAGGPARGTAAEGAGLGPGGGTRGVSSGYGKGGSFGNTGGAYSGDSNTNLYGNSLLVPLVGGSGGSGSPQYGTLPGCSGGGGGGAVLLASDTKITVTGMIRAKGGMGVLLAFDNCSGPGSGGAVRLVAPQVVGNGQIDASPGNSAGPAGGAKTWAGGGRIRIDSTTPPGVFSFPNTSGPSGYLGTPSVPTYGRSMFVFPPAANRFFFLSAAGQDIAPNASGAVMVTLPNGSPTNQPVTLCGYAFTGPLSVQVVATPDVGPVFRTNFVMNFPSDNQTTYITNTVNVTLLNGRPTQLNAYARYGVMP